jgi:hypothetical protein
VSSSGTPDRDPRRGPPPEPVPLNYGRPSAARSGWRVLGIVVIGIFVGAALLVGACWLAVK